MDEIKLGKIQWLPRNLIAQLKAGEVIERPSQALKELLENSLDAQATEITIHLEEAGLKKIEIEDNGYGMSSKDLLIAFEPHTTSKIFSIFDLFKIKSYGFRGEALSSMRSVSDISCETDNGFARSRIDYSSGEQTFFSEGISLKKGTKIVLYDLFKNHPVRSKFLQASFTEKKQIKKILLYFLILHPHILFKIKIDDEFYFYPQESKKERISRFYKIIEELKNEKDDLSSHITLVQSKHESLIYVNNRIIYHQGLKKFLEEKFQFKFILFLQVKNEDIDVNVHPQKNQIKFLKENEIFSFLNQSQSFEKNKVSNLNLLKNYHKFALVKDLHEYYIFDLIEAKKCFLKDESKKKSFSKIPFPEKVDSDFKSEYVKINQGYLTHFIEDLNFTEFKDVLFYSRSITSKELLKKLLINYPHCKKKIEDYIL